MPKPPEVLDITCVDGAFVPSRHARISAFDRGFLLGDGVFETIGVKEGVPLSLRPHLARLQRSARFIRLALPEGLSVAPLAQLIADLIARNGPWPTGREAGLRLSISRGMTPEGPPTLVAFMREVSQAHLDKRQKGVLGFTLPSVRRATSELTQHKTLNYLASALGQLLLRDRTSEARAEGFFVDQGGRVLEGTASNLFIAEGGRLVTPPLGGLLPGITRQTTMDLATEIGIEVAEEPLDMARLRAADEVFISSSTLPVAAVVALDDAPVGRLREGAGGPILDRLRAALDAHVAAEIAAWHAERGGRQ